MRKSCLVLTLCFGACAAPSEREIQAAEMQAILFSGLNGDGLPDARPVQTSFVDSDGDGLPDTVTSKAAYIDSDGDGLPDKRVLATEHFVDTNGDGIPDTRVYK